MKNLFLVIICIAVSAYSNAQSWHEIGGGNNVIYPYQYNRIWSICNDKSGNVYATGGLHNANGNDYVAKWNGTTWSQLGSLEFPGTGITTVCADTLGNVYVSGSFPDSNGATYAIAKWNGNVWAKLDSHIGNIHPKHATRMYLDGQGRIYAASADTGIWNIVQWNGSSWEKLGTGNDGNFGWDIYAIATDSAGHIYIGGNINDSIGCYVARWNGNVWTDIGVGGITGSIETLCTDPSGNVYATGNSLTDANGKYYVSKWNGSSWSELGTGSNALNANSIISSVQSDKYGNIYAVGAFTNAIGKHYVAKWNGTNWSDIGSLNANSNIECLSMDNRNNGIMYAGGAFKNSAGIVYVAQYGYPSGISVPVQTRLKVYPNPASNTIHIDGLENDRRIIITDIAGRVKMQQKLNFNNQINISILPDGVYFLNTAIGRETIIKN